MFQGTVAEADGEASSAELSPSLPAAAPAALPAPVVELDASSCADELTCSHAAIVAAEHRQLRLVAHWCDLHRTLPTCRRSGLPGEERMVTIAGDGTPAVREFAAAELGVLLGMSTTGAQGLMRDVLGLRHRHPRLYAAVLAGEARFFQARHVARLARATGLDLGQARSMIGWRPTSAR